MRSIIALVVFKVTKRDEEEHGTGDSYRLEEYITVTSNLQSKMITATKGSLSAPGALRVVG